MNARGAEETGWCGWCAWLKKARNRKLRIKCLFSFLQKFVLWSCERARASVPFLFLTLYTSVNVAPSLWHRKSLFDDQHSSSRLCWCCCRCYYWAVFCWSVHCHCLGSSKKRTLVSNRCTRFLESHSMPVQSLGFLRTFGFCSTQISHFGSKTNPKWSFLKRSSILWNE